MADLLRVYFDPSEIHPTTGYPYAWSQESEAVDQSNRQIGDGPRMNLPIKDLIRETAGHRCERCGHPYRKGEHGNGEWSACDEHCTHGGPVRVLAPDGSILGVGDYGEWARATSEDLGYEVATEIGSQFYGLRETRIEAQWRILTVHHLNGAKWDCRWWNLAALCQRCHLTIQGKVYLERPWNKPHTEWFKPHAAGFYASLIPGEEPTREETMARLDELLDLELTQEALF